MADDSKTRERELAWVFDYKTFELTCTASSIKESASWDLKLWYPHVDFTKLDDLEINSLVNGVRQRLADRSAVPAGTYSVHEKLLMRVALGKTLLDTRKYAVGGGGGGLSAEALWDKVYKEATAQNIKVGIPENIAKLAAQATANGLHPKAPQAVMLADLAEFNAAETTAERKVELTAKYPDLDEFKPPKPAAVLKKGKGK